MRLGETKLLLDEAVAGEALGAAPVEGEEGENAVESVAEKQIKATLVESIKRQLEAPALAFAAGEVKTEGEDGADVKAEEDER